MHDLLCLKRQQGDCDVGMGWWHQWRLHLLAILRLPLQLHFFLLPSCFLVCLCLAVWSFHWMSCLCRHMSLLSVSVCTFYRIFLANGRIAQLIALIRHRHSVIARSDACLQSFMHSFYCLESFHCTCCVVFSGSHFVPSVCHKHISTWIILSTWSHYLVVTTMVVYSLTVCIMPWHHLSHLQSSHVFSSHLAIHECSWMSQHISSQRYVKWVWTRLNQTIEWVWLADDADDIVVWCMQFNQCMKQCDTDFVCSMHVCYDFDEVRWW